MKSEYLGNANFESKWGANVSLSPPSCAYAHTHTHTSHLINLYFMTILNNNNNNVILF